MAEERATYPAASPVSLPATMPNVGLATFFFLLLAVAFSVYMQTPPQARPADAAPTAFSAARALTHIRDIATASHPVGSPEHARVRDYIVYKLGEQGLDPQVQQATVVSEKQGLPLRAGTVYNVVARLKGAGSGPAVALVAHYDSVPTGPGASDDGSGVATLIETLRALKASPPLNSDVLFLFTDAEEVGLLGARAFVDEHPWAKDVGLVLNFEARGNGGPVMMFETSNGNGQLIKEFAKAAPHPVATSLSYEIYKRLPNDTDLTMFKAADIAGLNFAFIQGAVHYHTGADTVQAVDERSLQQQGAYALALARHFGNLTPAAQKTGNAIYFDLFGLTLIHYPNLWALPSMVLVLVLLAQVVVLGFKRRLLTVSGVLLGFFGLLLSMICAAVSVQLVWWLVRALHTGYRALATGDTYNSKLYMMGFVALAAAITFGLYGLLRRRGSVESLSVGALAWWAVLMVLTSVLLPGASYLFTWPLLFSLLALGFVFLIKGRADKQTPSLKHALVLGLGGLPAITLFAPTIYLVFIGLTLKLTGAVMIFVVLLCGLLMPTLGLLPQAHRRLLPAVLALAGVVFIVAGSLTAGFNEQRPRQDSMFYGLNADTGQAVWASADPSPDAWTAQFFNHASAYGTASEYLPLMQRNFLLAQAQPAPLPAPRAELLSDETTNGLRTLRLRITSPRHAPIVAVSTETEGQVSRSAVNGKTFDVPPEEQEQLPWAVRYYDLPQEGFALTLQTKSARPLALRVIDQTYGLAQVPGSILKPRPADVTTAPQPYNDSTFVSKSYKF